LGLQAGAETFGDRVMKDVRSARASRGTSMLAQDIGTTTGQLASEGSAMRERLSGVNPLDVINLTARQRAGTLGTLATQAQAQTGIEGNNPRGYWWRGKSIKVSRFTKTGRSR